MIFKTCFIAFWKKEFILPYPVLHSYNEDIFIHLIRDYIAKDYISVVYIPSNSNLSDMFTKPLPAVKLNNFSIVRGKV